VGPPFVSVYMPCLNERHHVEACLRGVLAQDYPGGRLEVLVADGRSTDGTREILAGISAADPRVVLVDNPARIQAPGMNEALRRARGDVLVRMDVHCDYAPDYVRSCVEALRETGAWNAGGAQRPRATTPFQQALCASLGSPLGVGGARYRSGDEEGDVDTVFLGAFPRRVFEEVGLYDPRAVTNEDAELNQRIREAGGRIHLSRRIVVHYHPRRTFGALARQYFRYGRGRARTLLKTRAALTPRPYLPAAMVAGGAILVATAGVQPLTPWALAAYALLAGAEAVRVARRLGARGVLTAWAIFPVLHVSHGAGFWAGLAHYLRRPDWGPPERLPPRAPSDQ
jgi:succinoglycan biosynthesis protein ExoA